MAVPFFLPEGGTDDIASSSSGASGNSSPHNPHSHPPLSAHSTSGASSSSSSSGVSSASSAASSASSDGASSVASQSPNTTTSATQTPMQSPLPTDQVLYALCEWVRIYQQNQQNGPHIFQYPPPPSPSCNYTGGEIFFPHGPPNPNPHPRTPRTSVSFSAGEEYNFFRQATHHAPYPAPSTPQPMPPQSAPAMHCSHSYPQQSAAPHLMAQHHSSPYGMGGYYASYTPPPTPNTASAGSASTSSVAFGWPQSHQPIHSPGLASTPLSAPLAPKMRLQRSQSDAARRDIYREPLCPSFRFSNSKRLTSTGEDEREYQSDYETSWDEFDDRYDNFTAGRERLQEFNGRIPPRKKKTSATSSSTLNPITQNESQLGTSSSECSDNITNSQNHQRQVERERQRAKAEKKKPQSFTWPTVVTVFVLAMGCGFFAAR
ncbi:cell death protein hid isoform X1 [Drosophila bipectinata]|uniref:cell death protein hid isoform X1 n=1 Tax=Drosophila bipectinata TaxID=42026 RepID=UPI001C898134|nr:cell death protein hid isoform X1 [Drosophila bipectinata]